MERGREPVTVCKRAEEYEKQQGVNPQCGNNTAEKTGKYNTKVSEES